MKGRGILKNPPTKESGQVMHTVPFMSSGWPRSTNTLQWKRGGQCSCTSRSDCAVLPNRQISPFIIWERCAGPGWVCWEPGEDLVSAPAYCAAAASLPRLGARTFLGFYRKRDLFVVKLEWWSRLPVAWSLPRTTAGEVSAHQHLPGHHGDGGAGRTF